MRKTLLIGILGVLLMTIFVQGTLNFNGVYWNASGRPNGSVSMNISVNVCGSSTPLYSYESTVLLYNGTYSFVTEDVPDGIWDADLCYYFKIDDVIFSEANFHRVTGAYHANDSDLLNEQLPSFYLDATNRTDEDIEDVAGAMWTGNTETGIALTYQDGDGTVDAVVSFPPHTNRTDADITGLTYNTPAEVYSATPHTNRTDADIQGLCIEDAAEIYAAAPHTNRTDADITGLAYDTPAELYSAAPHTNQTYASSGNISVLNGVIYYNGSAGSDTNTWNDTNDVINALTGLDLYNGTLINASCDARDSDTWNSTVEIRRTLSSSANISYDATTGTIYYNGSSGGTTYTGGANISTIGNILSLNITCADITGSAALCDGDDDAGAGSFDWNYTDGSSAGVINDAEVMSFLASGPLSSTTGGNSITYTADPHTNRSDADITGLTYDTPAELYSAAPHTNRTDADITGLAYNTPAEVYSATPHTNRTDGDITGLCYDTAAEVYSATPHTNRTDSDITGLTYDTPAEVYSATPHTNRTDTDITGLAYDTPAEVYSATPHTNRTDADITGLTYDTPAEVYSATPHTNLTEDNVEAFIFDADNTDNFNVNSYNVTNIDCLKFDSGGQICTG